MANQRTTLRKKRNWLKPALIVLVLLLCAAGFWYWKKGDAGKEEGAWRTTAIEKGNIRVAISATGTLSAISTVTVGSQISGQVLEVLADFNTPVKKGDILAKIDPSTYQTQIEQGSAHIASAEASLRQAQAGLKNAELDYQRKAQLGQQQLVAKSDIDLARAARDQAKAQVASAQAVITQQRASTQTTRLNLERTVIRSPVDGVVLTRTIEPGQTVAASLQAPELFTIAEDLSKMQILLNVDESDIGKVKTGQSVTFTADAFSDTQFNGVVEQVRLAATTTNNVVTYPVVVTVDNSSGQLLPGLTVNAEIEVSKRNDVLLVSNAALRYKPSEAIQSAMGAQQPAAQGGGRNNSGMQEELLTFAKQLNLTQEQQQALDQAVAAIQERNAKRDAERQAQQPGGQQRGGRCPGMFMMGPGSGPTAAMLAQMRQRMLDRITQDYSAFRATLNDEQRAQWDAKITSIAGATRAPIYKLVNGKPEAVMVRVGESDGTNTEITGNVKQGEQVITGERAPK